MKNSPNFWRSFNIRGAISLFIIFALFMYSILRVSVIAVSDYNNILENQNCVKLKISDLRGTIYDCNMIPLTNNKKKVVAAVSPTERAKTALKSKLNGEELKKALDKLELGKPIICEVPEFIDCDGIVCTEIYETIEDNTFAVHTVGYTDSDKNGVIGLEKAYNEILSSEKDAYVAYECDGNGQLLKGAEPILHNDTSITAGGIVSTIDINIQNIAENAANSIERGAIVIAEANSGKIRASVSRPTFNVINIEEYLKDSTSPLLNRTINAYNVGSVFKPCVAAAGIEKGLGNYKHNCTGSSKIIDRVFKCHKLDGHGYLDLEQSIANSCNTYFYNLAAAIGEAEILKTASAFHFGNSLKLCDGIYTAKGSLPHKESLSNIAHLANFSIGQGELLLSPVSMLTLYCAIATDGKYYIPSLIEGTIYNGALKEYNIGSPTRVMSKETSDILKNCLKAVIENGTGTDAKPKTTTAAGKTATAQTGKFINGVEINEGWFCGFFPADNPKYVAIIFSENTAKQTKTCSKIFSEIADEIMCLK